MNFRFRDIREDHDLKQHQIAKDLEMSRSTYSAIEAECDNIKLSTYNNYCNIFSYSMDYVARLTNKLSYNGISKIKTLDKAIIAERLKTIETEQQKEAQEIAAELGISPSTYCGYKSKRRKELIQTLMVKHLAEHYGYSMDWIVGRSKNKYIKK